MMCNIDAEVDLDDADGVISEDNKEDNVCLLVLLLRIPRMMLRTWKMPMVWDLSLIHISEPTRPY